MPRPDGERGGFAIRGHDIPSRHIASYPSPVVSSGGRLFVAPADGDRVYALDPESGRVLWQTGPTIGARILGACPRAAHRHGRWAGQGDLGTVRGDRTLSVAWWLDPAAGILGYGQGFVTEDIIVWPTRSDFVLLAFGGWRPTRRLPSEPR